MLFLLSLSLVIVAAWLGYSALVSVPLNSDHLKLALALLAASLLLLFPLLSIQHGMPTNFVREFRDIDVSGLGILLLWPLVGVAILGGWALRRSGWWETPSPEYLALIGPQQQHVDQRGPDRTTGTIADLHLPNTLLSVSTISILLIMAWTIATPRNGRDAGPLLMELLSIVGTMLASAAAIVCGLVWASRPSPGVAVVYAGLSLIVIAGGLFILAAGYLADDYRGLYVVVESGANGNPYAWGALVMSTIAAAPAIIGEVMWRTKK